MEQLGFEFDDFSIFYSTECEGSREMPCGKDAFIFFNCENCGSHSLCHGCIWGDPHIDHECSGACCVRGHILVEKKRKIKHATAETVSVHNSISRLRLFSK